MDRLGTAGARVAWTVLGCVGLAGCFSPRVSEAECLRCPDNVCPGDLVCLEKRCINPNSPNSCVPASSTGGTSSTGSTGGTSSTAQSGEAGAAPASGGIGNTGHGGTTSHGGHGSGGRATAGGAGTGGTAPEGGDAGQGGDSGIGVVGSVTSVCSGVATDISLEGKNGTPPYHLDVIHEPAGLAVMDSGDGVVVSGTFTTLGDVTLTVRVTDADQNSAIVDVSWKVKETPVLTTSSLPDVCPDEIYTARLTAMGGDGRYTFAADGLERTNLDVRDDKITGHFPNDGRDAASVDVNVSVKSDGCASVPTALTLKENPVDASACPQIALIGGDPALPLPCAGNDYAVSFTAYSGAPGYVWADAPMPQGLKFDPRTQTVSGVPQTTAPATLTVQVTDDSGRIIAHDFPFGAPRDKCWFGYLAPPTGSTQLNLLDPLLGNRRVFPSGANTEPALDFKFSPNGHLLAYRTGTDPNVGHLGLIELATFREQVFDFQAVKYYTWSADSRTLVVGFGPDDARVLGGVDTSGDGGAGTGLGFPELTAVPAQVDSDPVWYAGSRLAFFTGSGYREVNTTSFSTSGFSAVKDRFEDAFDDGARLLPGPDGIFAIPSNAFNLDFIPSDGSSFILHNHVLAQPTGELTARQEFVPDPQGTGQVGQLELFRARTNSVSDLPAVPDATTTGCDALLGWAAGGDRILCSHVRPDDTTQSELVLFEIDSGTLAISEPITVRNGYDFPNPGLTGLARLFSPSGKRLAFTTDSHVYSTPTASGGATVDLNWQFHAAPGGSNAVLAFSPDERFLLEHRGSKLSLFDLENTLDPPPPFGTGDEFAPAPACSEDYHAAAGSYCGELRSRAPFTWSPASWLPGSLLVALSTSDGKLLVRNIQVLDRITTMNATNDCGQGCVAENRFAFQP